MIVRCPKCGKNSSVLSSRLSQPGYQITCPGCNTTFAPAPPAGADAAKPAAPVTAASPSASPPPQNPGAAVAVPKPKPAVVMPPPLPPKLPSAPSPADEAGVDVRPARPNAAPAWLYCIEHPKIASVSLCLDCDRGFCANCSKTVQSVFICPICGGPCRTPQQEQQSVELLLVRSRSMREEIPTILAYPFNDRTAFILLSLVVWVFAVLGSIALFFGGGIAYLFSQGLLMAYSFTALAHVSDGNMKNYMPDISDISDLVKPVWLGFGVLLVSSLPLISIIFLYPGATLLNLAGSEPAFTVSPVYAQEAPEESAVPLDEEDEEDDEEVQPEDLLEPAAPMDEGDYVESEDYEGYGAPAGIKLLLLLAFLWHLGFAPAALTVAGMTRSFAQTVNPVVGFDTIRRMGNVYWDVAGIYTGLTLVQGLLGLVLALIPIAGGLINAFIDSYAALVIGCTLGLAVRKKAPELGLE